MSRVDIPHMTAVIRAATSAVSPARERSVADLASWGEAINSANCEGDAADGEHGTADGDCDVCDV